MVRRGNRLDDQLRRITITRGVNQYAEGSCLIEFGSTRIMVTATVDRNVPLFLKGKAEGWITCEYGMLPRATQNRINRDRVSGRIMEIQRLIGRSLRSVVNLKALGERTIWVDCDVIQADGGTRTASVVGGFVALVECLYVLYREAMITSFPLDEYLGAVSVGIVRGKRMLDLSYQEDYEADVDMNVVMKSSGEFVEVQGTAENGSFSRKDLDLLLEYAHKGIKEIIEIERETLKDIFSKV